jgi:multisubunit Na+/H+ antiporter MnhE subunit
VVQFQVAWLAIRPGPPLTAVLRTHLNIKSDLVLALAVNIINLIPGSIVLEIDQVRRMIYVHQLDVGPTARSRSSTTRHTRSSGCWWPRSSGTSSGSRPPGTGEVDA